VDASDVAAAGGGVFAGAGAVGVVVDEMEEMAMIFT
jgi:hypothetical protein